MPGLLFLFFASLAQAQPSPFTDSDLHRLESKKKSTIVIYSWSPHMNLSIRGLNQALERARQGGDPVVAVLDPACNYSLAKKIAEEHGWPKEVLRVNASEELNNKGFRVHYPSYLFLSHGKVASPLIPGYKTEKELAWFQQHFLP